MPRRFMLWLTVLAPAVGLALAPATAEVAEVRIAASADDAEQNSSGSVSVVGSDLELVWDNNSQTLGLRFPGLAVPQSAEITNAWVQFESDETNATAVTISFEAQAADDAPPFTTTAQSISARPREPGSVTWSPPPWTSVGVAGPEQRTPDLAALVQAVVNRPGWASGNALALIVSGSDTGKRTARSFNGNPAGAALLHVEYSFVEVNDPPTLSILSPVHLTQRPPDEAVPLVALASDPEDGALSNVGWVSSRDGIIGQGASTSSTLSVGIHTISAHVSDSEGLTVSDSHDVEVTADGLTVLAAGDIASCNSTGDEATAALLDEHFGDVITLGDNAYPDGTAAQFQNCYGPSWGRHKERTHPATGNHEYHTTGAAGHFGYFGAAAGDPSEGWYSYDLGAWHVVVLNSNCSRIGGCTRSSPQGLWLEADLAANPRDCTLAAWHHPRFSSGASHGSSTTTRDLYDILHSHRADLILAGHDHNYERFAPQDAFGIADPAGPTQFVVGSGGASLRPMGGIEPNSLTSAGNVYGVLKLTLHETSYDWEFLPAAGFSYTDGGSASCVVGSGPVNESPTAAIHAPAHGARFMLGAPIDFSGSASDPEDGDLTNTLSWSSDRDGVIGAGGAFTSSALSVGAHQIRASVQDSSGLPALAEISLVVTQPNRVVIEKRIAATADDVEEEDGGAHDVALASPDLELVLDANEQIVGLRFAELPIPRGARVLDAWLQFQADGSTSSATSLVIQAQAVDDAPTFTRTARNVSSRALGSASVAWAPASWISGAQGEAQRSPSLVSLVQQVVDRAGWVSGNALVLVVSGSGERRSESYDGIREGAPLLHVEYQREEQPGSTQGCGIGPELTAAITLLAWLRRRRRLVQA
ncbi:MAG: metallophosphoesterase family protein [Myxococcota bacterium]